MSAKRVFVVAVALMIGLAAGAFAGITCTVTDLGNGRISVLVETDAPPLVESQISNEDNVTVDMAGCLDSALPVDSCTLFAKGLDLPATATIEFKDSGSDEFQQCGPFTEVDGLPVELVEFSVG